METIYGYVLAIVAIFFFGSTGMPLKVKKVAELKTFYLDDKKKGIHPLVYHMYFISGIFLSNLFVYTFVDFQVDVYVIGAAISQTLLFIPISILIVIAVQKIGISIAISIWAGVSILVPFIWGIILFPDANQVNEIPYCIFSLILLIVGLINFGTSFKVELAESDKNNEKINWSGIIISCIIGLLNGSLLVPIQGFSKFSKIEPQVFALNVIPIFSLFNIILSLILVIGVFNYQIKKIKWIEYPNFHLKVAAPAGMGSGFLWSVGNLCAIYATLSLGMSLGYPLTQLSLIVNGLWGLVVFKELKKVVSIIIWISSVISLIMGAFILSDSLNSGIF